MRCQECPRRVAQRAHGSSTKARPSSCCHTTYFAGETNKTTTTTSEPHLSSQRGGPTAFGATCPPASLRRQAAAHAALPRVPWASSTSARSTPGASAASSPAPVPLLPAEHARPAQTESPIERCGTQVGNGAPRSAPAWCCGHPRLTHRRSWRVRPRTGATTSAPLPRTARAPPAIS